MTLLWATRQALADLGFEALAGSYLEPVKNRHPILASFFKNRSDVKVTGTERLKQVPLAAEVWNLHAQNPHRAVTWYDHVEDVVYLLAYSPHDYKEFVRRYGAGTLLPAAVDYADVGAYRRATQGLDDDFIEVVEAQRPDLVARARRSPGSVVSHVLGGGPAGCGRAGSPRLRGRAVDW